MKHRFAAILRRSIPAALILSLLLLPVGRSAEAWEPFDNFMNGIETFGKLPSEVNQLRQSYEKTVDELEGAKADIQAYRNEMEIYRNEINQLNEQNKLLDEQNRQLQQTVTALNAVQEEREQSSRTLKTVIFVLVGLLVGYFIFIRVLRLGLRGRR
ncbi:hypothetical protein [Saccharibacillus kuerlensis]|uniref:Uncharacterized protein n=1 Tax=Saccharibacillus kuerlensis TaxID=459527 RepID=A0ABQ2L0X5_9BACL|nr:hypothetical protein [Saccharibacillus kuerlensis]GGN98970.1 hypothetical protein GCM10010969_18710 [Saccharibacillus kuerlensis]